MFKRRLIWQLYPSFLLIIIIPIVGVTWYWSQSLRKFYLNQVAEDLKSRAHLIEKQISMGLTDQSFDQIDDLCKQIGLASTTRITIILPDGQVIADSDEQPAKMGNHADRPEFQTVLEQGSGSSIRFSQTLGKRMMYLAIALKQDGKVLAVIRTSVPVTAIDKALNSIYAKLLWAGVIIAVCAAVISLALSKRISMPIEKIKETARSFAAGNLDLRLSISKPIELAELAEAMNKMARQLNEKISTITTQNSESDAILSSMVEGVIAIDAEGCIVRINRAAASFLNVNTKQAERHKIAEAIDNIDIVEFAQESLNSSAPTEADIVLAGDEKRFLKLHGTRLSDVGGKKTGAVIVLTDVTRLQQLEKIRRDFVANVSHELKTPITSIKGFVETLQEGALTESQQARRFLEIIGKHSDRLNAIIDDLLSLSRLEEDSEKRMLSFETTLLKPVLTDAITLSEIKAEEKHIQVNLNCKENIEARINPALLEQAITNLIDNAIKYSTADSKIWVEAEQNENEIIVEVRDQGCGIDKKYQERIFERFYVVDKGRSRKLGGTGLGLSIVKHIAQVHGGHIEVESTVGKGSTFKIRLPVN
ncbi:MAG: cell wall metabolism sensor histidine kinase WalK [Planctomycetes bacterium]|nr:cell wall metabolism sensor histidine kinase WalK [Planctomycetota bacterium]MBU1517886.1 cell wall metabolism sensor histidine kinase WalK [Planctomycetota bacterium]MBU2458321.1 cell wall metabolism sensor histidine kinase WalK [Planctomycetota bacterium]MBU2596170.1 cell wall metabolism sensor histidine kinase WalK [Planctomycetota bacterium]